jgi:integrase
VKVPELETSVFVIPGERVKNGEERLVVLNRVARSVIERMRGLHPVHVFVHARAKDGDPRPVTKINNTAWKAAREQAARCMAAAAWRISTGRVQACSGA